MFFVPKRTQYVSVGKFIKHKPLPMINKTTKQFTHSDLRKSTTFHTHIK